MPPRTLQQNIFDDGLGGIEYPSFGDIKMKVDLMLPRQRLQPTVDRAKKVEYLQKKREQAEKNITQNEEDLKELLKVELEYNEVYYTILKYSYESDLKNKKLYRKRKSSKQYRKANPSSSKSSRCKISSCWTRSLCWKIVLGSRLAHFVAFAEKGLLRIGSFLCYFQDNDIKESLDEQRTVIAETEPDDDVAHQLTGLRIGEAEAASLEAHARRAAQLRETVDRKRKPLAKERETRVPVEYERARRIEQIHVCLCVFGSANGWLNCNWLWQNDVPAVKPSQQQPTIDRSVKPSFGVVDEAPVYRNFNAEPGSEVSGNGFIFSRCCFIGGDFYVDKSGNRVNLNTLICSQGCWHMVSLCCSLLFLFIQEKLHAEHIIILWLKSDVTLAFLTFYLLFICFH